MTRTSSGIHLEYAAEVALDVLHALGFIVDRELAVALEYDRRRIKLHRVVMLDRHIIFALMAHFGGSECFLGRAAWLWRSEGICSSLCRRFQGRRLFPPAMHIGDMRFLVIIDPH